MVCRPLLVEGVLHVLRGWDTGGEKTTGLRKACDVERSHLRSYFGPVAPSLSCLEVVGVGQGVSHLIQLSFGDLPGLVDPLEDLSRGPVGHLALLSACPEPTPVLVVLTELSRLFKPFASHVRSSVLPHRVVPRSVRVHRVIAHIFVLPELSSLDESGIPWPLRELSETLGSWFTFTLYISKQKHTRKPSRRAE